jgi:hypothetical protein
MNPIQLGRFGTTLSWIADIGKRYQVLTTTSLPAGAGWQALAGPITATNEVMSVLDGNRAAPKFYRLQILP